VPTVFTHNRERLLEAEIVHKLFAAVLEQAKRAGLTSDEHFSVDGTLIEAWASMKSFRRKNEPPTGNPTPAAAAKPARAAGQSSGARNSSR
jgi:hypothetical protein